MSKKLVVLVALLAMFFFVGGAFAGEDTDVFNVIGWRIDEDGVLRPKSTSGRMAITEYVTTSNAVTAAESGKTFVVDSASTVATMTLPTAAIGLEYTVVSATNEIVRIDVADTDTIAWPAIGYMDAGDKLVSPGATGDSVTLVCPRLLYWYPSSINGSWTDGGPYR